MDPKLHAHQVADLASRRNFGIMAHIDAGKTTVSERILYYTGVIRKVQEVHDGGATMDYMEDEKERGITITSAATYCEWKGKKLSLIDTPGHVDFTAEVERSLRVLDGAVAVFDAVSGVEAQSETVWRQATKYNVPRICFVNKMDRAGADFFGCIESIRKRLGAKAVPIQVPIMDGQNMMGAIDLVEMEVILAQEGDDPIRTKDLDSVSPEIRAQAEKSRIEMIEAIADYSDALMETYLEGGHVTRDEIRQALREGTLRSAMHPVLCGSALKNRGVRSLLDAICDYLPSPHDLEPLTGATGPKDETEQVRKHDENEPFCGLAFKTVSDPNGDLTFVRVYSGVLNRGDEVVNVRTGKKERIGRLLRMHANNREAMDRVRAGDICAVVGLKHSITGDTLADKAKPIMLESMEFPDTVISMSINPESRGDRDKLGEALARLAKEDPTFRRFTDPETEETIIAGMGELHLEIIASRLLREFKVPVITGKPRVAYRQTLAKAIEVEGRHVKQTGGSGQFGVCKVQFEPDHESTDITFESKVVGGRVPKEFIPAIEYGIVKYCEDGGDLRLPIVGVKATLVDGKSHDVDSSEIAFRAAGRLAIRGALEQAGCTIMEPLMRIEVTTPDEFVGNVIGDLNSRRMQIDEIAQGPGDIRIVRGKVPIAETFQYSTTLRSLTQGRANFSMEPCEYMPVPRSLQEVIVKEQLARRKKK